MEESTDNLERRDSARLIPHSGFRIRHSAVAALAACLGTATVRAADADRYAAPRDWMVETEIIAAGIKNPRVIQAMRATPRHEFVSRQQRPYAYFDMAMPIGHGQTISPPYVVAFMTEQLDPQPADNVLEIGTGSGYQAAVLSGLVANVYSIEIVEPLGRRAASTLRRLGLTNVHTKIGDGYQGWAEHAPFDKIIVTCSPEKIPQALVDQLVEGGRLVVPLGKRFQQTLYLFKKANGQLEREALRATFFVPMTGRAEQARQVKPNETFTELVHGSFEETMESSDQPLGWFYVRQGRVVADPKAPAGQRCLTFSNTTPGRHAQAMQAFGVDGRVVRKLEISSWIRGRDLRQGQNRRQQPGLIIEYYGQTRAPVGDGALGPILGTLDWEQRTTQVPVPTAARLAVVGVGLFGATGEISFDQVEVRAVGIRPSRSE